MKCAEPSPDRPVPLLDLDHFLMELALDGRFRPGASPMDHRCHGLHRRLQQRSEHQGVGVAGDADRRMTQGLMHDLHVEPGEHRRRRAAPKIVQPDPGRPAVSAISWNRSVTEPWVRRETVLAREPESFQAEPHSSRLASRRCRRARSTLHSRNDLRRMAAPGPSP